MQICTACGGDLREELSGREGLLSIRTATVAESRTHGCWERVASVEKGTDEETRIMTVPQRESAFHLAYSTTQTPYPSSLATASGGVWASEG